MDTKRMNEKLFNQTKFHFDNIYKDNPRLYESIILYQIGDLSCEGGYQIGSHTQHCYEISYIVSGCGIYYTDGKSYPVKAGDIFINLPGQQHDGKADTIDPFRYFYIGFNFDNSHEEQDAFQHMKKMFDQIEKQVVPDMFGIQNAFVSIFNELINLKEFSPLMIKTYIHQIIILAYRNFYDTWKKEYIPPKGMDETKKIVYDIVNYIDTNLCNITELKQIANELGYSYSHLSHIFTREIGLTIKDYYNRKRFEKAVEWLKNSDMSITGIAQKLQYQSIHSFSKAFRKNFGISPTEYLSLYETAKNEQ